MSNNFSAWSGLTDSLNCCTPLCC